MLMTARFCSLALIATSITLVLAQPTALALTPTSTPISTPLSLPITRSVLLPRAIPSNVQSGIITETSNLNVDSKTSILGALSAVTAMPDTTPFPSAASVSFAGADYSTQNDPVEAMIASELAQASATRAQSLASASLTQAGQGQASKQTNAHHASGGTMLDITASSAPGRHSITILFGMAIACATTIITLSL